LRRHAASGPEYCDKRPAPMRAGRASVIVARDQTQSPGASSTAFVLRPSLIVLSSTMSKSMLCVNVCSRPGRGRSRGPAASRRPSRGRCPRECACDCTRQRAVEISMGRPRRYGECARHLGDERPSGIIGACRHYPHEADSSAPARARRRGRGFAARRSSRHRRLRQIPLMALKRTNEVLWTREARSVLLEQFHRAD